MSFPPVITNSVTCIHDVITTCKSKLLFYLVYTYYAIKTKLSVKEVSKSRHNFICQICSYGRQITNIDVGTDGHFRVPRKRCSYGAPKGSTSGYTERCIEGDLANVDNSTQSNTSDKSGSFSSNTIGLLDCLQYSDCNVE